MEKPTLIYVIICMLAVAIILLVFVLKKLSGKEDLTGITEKLKTDIAEEKANR